MAWDDYLGDIDFVVSVDTVVIKAYMEGIAVQGNWFRSNAQVVAAAASLGLISTKNPDGTHGRLWRPTHGGMVWMQEGGLL